MANWWEAANTSGNTDSLGPASSNSPYTGGMGDANKPEPGFECPPGERRRPTMDGWECVPDGSNPEPAPAPNTNVYGCPGTDVMCNLDANGKETTPSCMSQAECSRRNQLWIGKNPGNPQEQNTPSTSTSSSSSTTAPKITKSPYADAMAKLLFEQLQRMLNGEEQPFSPDVVAKLNAGALGSNKAQLETSQRDLQKRLIASGLSRSGVAPSEQGRLRSRADAALSGDFRNIAITAVQQNYAAKAQALSQAQAFLNSERASALSTDQLAFGYAQLAQQWKSLQAQFEQQKWVVNTGNESALMQLLIQLQNGGL